MSRDIIADALSAIKNASMVRKEEALIPYSKLIRRIVEILKENGYIENFKEMNIPYKMIKVYLRYEKNKPVINQIHRISKPGRRVYVNRAQIPTVLGGYGIAILSTSRGVMSNREAKRQKVGGEVICYVW